MIRILIVDDHGVVRRGLAEIINDASGMVVVGEAADGQAALSVAGTTDPDVAILDIAMPGRGGLDVLRELKARKPALKVIVLSIYAEEQYAIRSLRDGASAYLTKASRPEELIQAVRAVAVGKRYLTPAVADRLAAYIQDGSHSPPHEALSDREMEVLVNIGSGKQLREIAIEMRLSAKTVSTYRSRLLQKMGMVTNAQLVRYAIEHRLAP